MAECEFEKRFCTKCVQLDKRFTKVRVKTPKGFRLDCEMSDWNLSVNHMSLTQARYA